MITCIFIGISGVTCSGKTTLATQLYNFFKNLKVIHYKNTKTIQFIIENCFIISQDDYFLQIDDLRHKKVFGLNHINWDCLGALDMEKMINDLEKLQTHKLHTVNNEQAENKIPKVRIIFIEGFLILEHSKLSEIIQIKFHLHIPVEKCIERRIKRIYNPPDIIGYFEICIWPSYLEHYTKIKRLTDLIHLNGYASITSLFMIARDFILDKLWEI